VEEYQHVMYEVADKAVGKGMKLYQKARLKDVE
jgi:hypothetical protein